MNVYCCCTLYVRRWHLQLVCCTSYAVSYHICPVSLYGTPGAISSSLLCMEWEISGLPNLSLERRGRGTTGRVDMEGQKTRRSNICPPMAYLWIVLLYSIGRLLNMVSQKKTSIYRRLYCTCLCTLNKSQWCGRTFFKDWVRCVIGYGRPAMSCFSLSPGKGVCQKCCFLSFCDSIRQRHNEYVKLKGFTVCVLYFVVAQL